MVYSKKGIFWFILIAYSLLRVFFLPIEFTGDSYGYLCEVLKDDLWNSHHLLHKSFLKEILLLGSPYALWQDPMIYLSVINVIIGLASLLVLMNILEYRKWPYTRIYLALLLVGGSFVFLKYSHENETYILPVLLSLIGSRQFERGKIIQSALWLGLATLFHQIHIFWLLGLLFPYKEFKIPKSYAPLLIALFIPIGVYLGLALYLDLSLTNLLFHDATQGLVQLTPDLNNLKFTGINLIRIWIFGHGDLSLFWNFWNPYLSGFALLTISFGLIGLLVFLRESDWKFARMNWIQSYVVVGLLQLAFAFYSVGNIEFMVMIPFIVILSMKSAKWLDNTLMLGMTLLIWNTSQFILPMSKTQPNRLNDKITLLKRFSNNQAVTPIWTNESALLANYNEYYSSKMGDSTHFSFHQLQDSLPNSGLVLIEENGRLNRAQMMFDGNALQAKANWKRLYRDTGITGTLTLYAIPQFTNSSEKHRESY